MDTRDYLNRIISDATAALAQLPPPINNGVLVKAGDNLQAALDLGGVIRLDAGALFSGSFKIWKQGTRLIGGLGSGLMGSSSGPAFLVPPGARDIQASGFMAQTTWDQACVLLGLNDPAQDTPDKAPAGIMLTDIQVPKHRGKRAFEINSAQTALVNCGCADVFDPAGRDSQGIGVANSPGMLTVNGGRYEAGSENILVGGFGGTQAEKIVPSDLTFDGVILARPLSWMSDGGKRKVKTCFELKTGQRVTLKNATVDGCWVDGQTGYGLTVTPRDHGVISDIEITDVQLRNCGAGLNLLAQDDGQYSERVQRIALRRVIAVVKNGAFGSGRFVQLGGEVQGFVLEDNQFEGPDSIVTSYAAKTWDSPTSSRMSYVTKGAKLTGNSFKSGAYGLMLTGAAGAGAYGKFWKEAWPDGIISGNTFGGATGLAHKPNVPADNTFTS
jgi:hypothetical protein